MVATDGRTRGRTDGKVSFVGATLPKTPERWPGLFLPL